MFSPLNLQVIFSAIVLSSNLVQAGKLIASAPNETKTVSEQGGASASILQFPADWSRGAYPIGVNSHNDYWQGE